MQQPAWDDPGAGGTMVRGALWLLAGRRRGQHVHEEPAPRRLPGISQVDRRIRDLRDYGWVVYSSAEDASLLREDQRFVKAGVPVWDPQARRANAPEKTISTRNARRSSPATGTCARCAASPEASRIPTTQS